MSPAISVNKGCRGPQAISQPLQPQTVRPEGIQEGEKQDTGSR